MAHFHIEGLPPYDGDYEFDPSSLTNRELHTIKKLSGVRAGELSDAFAARDNDVLVALVVIALQRSGIQVDENVIWDADAGSIKLVGDPEGEEVEEGPPERAPQTGENGSGAQPTRIDSRSSSSGTSSGSDGGRLPSVPSRTGSPLSEDTARSDRVTSAS